MGLLFSELAEYKTVKAAAAAMAGNWKSWRHFVWWGDTDVPDSGNVMLGYLVNNEYTLRQLANLDFAKAELAKWWGDMTKGALAGDFGSSVSGDAGVLNGLMVRVFDEHGHVTEPFRKLYKIARRTEADGLLICDDETFERVRRREMLASTHRLLEHECRERGVPFTAELAERVTASLISNDVDYDNDDMDEEIEKQMGWRAYCQECDGPV